METIGIHDIQRQLQTNGDQWELLRLRESTGDSWDQQGLIRLIETTGVSWDQWGIMRLRESNGDSWDSETTGN